MSKVQAFANRVKSAAQQAREQFFGAKKDGFEYMNPMNSRLPRMREVAVSTVAVGSRRFARYDYEPIRGARTGV